MEKSAEAAPVLSVVVAARNEAATIGPCLDALLGQALAHGRLDVLVVDDGSQDATAAIVTGRGVPCLRLEPSGPSVARNRGAQAVRGAIVAFVDADAVVAGDWAARLLDAFATIDDPRLVAVGGSQDGHPDDSPFARDVDRFLHGIGFVADYTKPHANRRRVGHNASCNSAYRREAFLQAGGFRPGLFPGEDVDLDRRIADRGGSVWFTPEVRVAHHRPASVRAWLRMLVGYARCQADCVAIHGLFRLLHTVPLLWLAALLALTLFPGPLFLTGIAAILLASGILWRRQGLPPARGTFFLITTGLIYPTVFLIHLARQLLRRAPAPRRLPPLAG